MSFEEEFDSIIRRKSEELDHPFDEKNWDKVSALLDSERKVAAPKAGFKRLLVPALIAGVIAFSGIVIALSIPNAATTAEKSGPVADLTTTNTTADATANHTSGQTQANSLPTQPGELNPVTGSGQQTNSSPEVVERTADQTHVSANNNTRNLNAPKENSNLAANNTALIASKKDKVTANTDAPQTKTNDLAAASAKENNSTAGITNTKAANTSRKTKTSPGTETTNNTATPNSKNTPGKGLNEEPAVLAKTPQNTIDPLQPTAEPVASNAQETPLVLSEDQNERVELPLLFVSQPAQTEPEIATPLNHITRYDDDYVSKGKHKLHFANVELGGTYLLGWDTQAGKDGKGLDWFGGFNYGLYITRKISISAGLQAYNIKNITQAFYNSKQVDYGFGSVTTHTTITSNNLYYMAAPLKLAYVINKGSQFSIGANFGYLIGSKNTVEVYRIQGDIKTHDKPIKNTNIYQNASSMNIMLSAGYRVDVMPRLSLNTEVVYGITDIFKNTKTIKNNEQAVGVRLSLQYTLFDK